MPVVLDWKEIALRLVLTVIAGLVIGFNRGEHGRPAGMRTTLLVALAASLSMIQANLLLKTNGKPSDSFAVLDLMRLPLGILSGMGFIGAGTIIRKGSLVQGVTTAATLWFVTVMGLLFGGGQLGLGAAALALGWLALWGLKRVEKFMRQDMRGTLMVILSPEAPGDAQIRNQIVQNGCAVMSWGVAYVREGELREIKCELQWRALQESVLPPAAIEMLRSNPAVRYLRWHPQGLSSEVSTQQIRPEGTPVSISR